MKYFILSVILIFFTQCGYKPIYSNSKINFQIKSLDLNEKNYYIENKLGNLNTLNPNFFYDLKIISSEKKSVLSKDKEGRPKALRIEINLDVEVKENEKTIMRKNYINNFDYQNLDKKFELKEYEDEIRKDIFNRITNRILIDLKNLK